MPSRKKDSRRGGGGEGVSGGEREEDREGEDGVGGRVKRGEGMRKW